MAKKDSTNTILGLAVLGAVVAGGYYYLKSKGVDIELSSSDDYPSVLGASSSVGVQDVANRTESEMIQDMRDQGQAYLLKNQDAFSKNINYGITSNGGSYSLGQSIMKSGSSTPTIKVSVNNSPSQNVSIGANLPTYTSPSGTQEAGYLSITDSKNNSNNSSVVSRVAATLASPVNNVKKVLSKIF